MKKLLLIIALMIVAGFSSQANASVRFSVGVGGGYYDPYYPGYYSYPGYYGYYRPYYYYGPSVVYYRHRHHHHYYRY